MITTTLLLLFFTLLFFSTSSQSLESKESEFPLEEQSLSGWTTLDVSLTQANADPQIQDLLYTGAKDATQQAVQDGSLPSGIYLVEEVNSLEQNQENQEVYRFDVDVSNGQGANETIIFDIAYNSEQGTSELISYSISTPEIETYIPLVISAVSTVPQIQDFIALGILNLTQQAIQNSSLPSGTYRLGQIQGIGQGTLNPNAYQFNP